MPLTASTETTRNEPAFAGIWSRQYRRLTLGLTLVVSFAAFEALAVSTVLPAVARELAGLPLYGWAFSAFMLANLVGAVIAGGEADRQGPERPFVLGIALFVLGLVLTGTAASMIVVVISRAVQGFGAGIISSMAYVSIGRGYPQSARPRMLAVLSSAWVIPGLVGPALAGIIADRAGWRWVFLGLAPLPVLAALLALSALRRLRPETARDPDRSRTWAAVRLALGFGLVLAGIGARSATGALLIVPGAVLAWPALCRLLPPGSLVARHGLPAAIATIGLLNLAFFGVVAVVPLALTTVRGQSMTRAGLALTAATITWTTGAWIQAHLASRQGRRALVTVGLLIIAVGILGAAGALSPAVPVMMAALAWGVAGLGMGIAYSTAKLVVLEAATAGQEGAASSAMQITDVLGTALGTGLAGVIVGHASTAGQSPGSRILLVDLLMIGVLCLAAISASRLPRSTNPGL